ncbi:glycosyltransferase [Gammaproteobacteria bacterium 45_16_T64]|nr:glycosyltransferase [Gammaproteobacteria bacterium 45_16_T64]
MSTQRTNILQFICPTGFYGAERWILALAKNLDSEHINCDLAVTVEPGNNDLEISKHYKKLDKNVYEIPMSGRFDLSVISKLCKLIREKNIDIIHTHGYKSDILGLIAARLTGIKALATPHGFENAEDWKLRTYIGIGNQFLRWFDSLAPLSKQLCKDLQQIGVADKKVTYIQNGVDLDEVDQQRLRTDNPIIAKKTKKRVGFLGQMISRKNIFDLLDIFDELSREHDDVELVLLGDGEQRAELEEYTKTLPSKENIQFLGFRDDRLEWLQSFDIFVMTSTLEGIPRCLMETMAMGIPVAAYDIAGIDQLITSKEAGLLAPLGDKQGLKAHWEAILFDSNVASNLSEHARAYVLDNFSGRRMAREYTQLFKEILA